MVVAHDLLEYRVFSLTWPTSMQIYWNKRKRLRKKRVQIPQDWFGTQTWPLFHCFGTQIWPLWRHVKTHNRYMDDVTENLLFCFVQSSARSWKWLWDYFGLRQVKASKSKTCKRWQAAHLHRRESFENLFHIAPLRRTSHSLLGELFQGSYSLKFEPWYSFYIADQDTARLGTVDVQKGKIV